MKRSNQGRYSEAMLVAMLVVGAVVAMAHGQEVEALAALVVALREVIKAYRRRK